METALPTELQAHVTAFQKYGIRTRVTACWRYPEPLDESPYFAVFLLQQTWCGLD